MIESVDRLPPLVEFQIQMQVRAAELRRLYDPHGALWESMHSYIVALEARLSGIEMGLAVLRESAKK